VCRTLQKQKKTAKNSKRNSWLRSSKRKKQTSPVGKTPLQIEDESRDLRWEEIAGLVVVVGRPPRSMEIIRRLSRRKRARQRPLLLQRRVFRRLRGRRRGLLRVHDGGSRSVFDNWGKYVLDSVSLRWEVFGAVWRGFGNSFLYYCGMCICILHSFIITCCLVENTFVFLMESLLNPTAPTFLTRHML